MSDERYDRSADMRLLELQRKALGVPPRVMAATSYTDPEPIEDFAKDDDEEFVSSGTILVASIDAAPRSALIAGALVTIALSVSNDGDTAATDVHLSLALPSDTTYRPASLMLDGNSASDEAALSLFGSGAEIGTVEPGARRTLVMKLVVEAGTTDIVLAPHLRAAGGAVLGFRALRLVRARLGRGSGVAERPFYESDDEEHAAEALAPAPSEPIVAVLQPRELPPVIPSAAIGPKADAVPKAAPAAPPAKKPAADAKPSAAKSSKRAAPATLEQAVPTLAEIVADLPRKAAEAAPKAALKPRAKAKPKVKETARRGTLEAAERAAPAAPPAPPPAKISVVRSAGLPVGIEGRGGPILTVALDRKRHATLARLFSGPSLGMIAHYLLLNALAAKDALPGDGTDDSIAAFVASQEQLLSRALVATRLGKTPLPESVGAELPPFPPTLPAHTRVTPLPEPRPGQAVLVRALSMSELDYLGRAVSNDKAAPFLRTAQLFVGLCANDAVTSGATDRRETQVALTAYAAFATAEIGRIFLRAKLSRAPSLFRATEASFDEAARTVLATLGRLIA